MTRVNFFDRVGAIHELPLQQSRRRESIPLTAHTPAESISTPPVFLKEAPVHTAGQVPLVSRCKNSVSAPQACLSFQSIKGKGPFPRWCANIFPPPPWFSFSSPLHTDR